MIKNICNAFKCASKSKYDIVEYDVVIFTQMRIIIFFVLLFSVVSCSSSLQSKRLAMANNRMPSGNCDLIKEQEQDIQVQHVNDVINEYKFNENFDDTPIADISLTQLAPSYMEPMDIDEQVGLDNINLVQSNEQFSTVQEVKLQEIRNSSKLKSKRPYQKLSSIPEKKTSFTNQQKTIANKTQQLKILEQKSNNLSKSTMKSDTKQNSSASISRPSKEEIEVKLKQLQLNATSGSAAVMNKLSSSISNNTEVGNERNNTQGNSAPITPSLNDLSTLKPHLAVSSPISNNVVPNVDSSAMQNRATTQPNLTLTPPQSPVVINNKIAQPNLTLTPPQSPVVINNKISSDSDTSMPPSIPSFDQPVATMTNSQTFTTGLQPNVQAISPMLPPIPVVSGSAVVSVPTTTSVQSEPPRKTIKINRDQSIEIYDRNSIPPPLMPPSKSKH